MTVGQFEEWQHIAGYEGFYEVSNLGRVRSLTRRIQCSNRVVVRNGKVLKQNRDSTGHYQVCLCDHTKRKTHLVHRLVMAAFVGSCPDGMEVCHNNGNPADNRLVNLRYDTRSNNTLDKVFHGTHNWMESRGGFIPDSHFRKSPLVMEKSAA